MGLELGVIEGFYGPMWTAEQRAQLVVRVAGQGYGFYVYAPKAERGLRDDWRTPMPEARMAELAHLAAQCRALGMRWGVGLSPLHFDATPGSADWGHLRAALARLDAGCAPQELALLFDDMRGDDPQLAYKQAAIVAYAGGCTRAGMMTVCPTYYADDPVLDRVFGPRPPDYLAQLGQALDPAVRVFWTGEEVCSREFNPAHLQDVGQQLRRAPVLWDNYPVNDGPRMGQFLHLRAVTGRPASNAPWLAGHAVNPALQPCLSCIPLLTLAERYRVGEAAYRYGAAWQRAAQQVLGDSALVQTLRDDWLLLQDTGLDLLGAPADLLRARYAAFDHPAAREVVAWLDGFWRTRGVTVPTS